MDRQAVFGALLDVGHSPPCLACRTARRSLAATSTPRPPAEIPLARLKPDAVSPLPFGPAPWRLTTRSGCRPVDAGAVVADRSQGEHRRAPRSPLAPSLRVARRGFRKRLGAALRRSRHRARRPQGAAGDGAAAVPLRDADPTGASPAAPAASGRSPMRRACCRGSIPRRMRPVAEVYVAAGATVCRSGRDALWVTSADAGRC